METENVNLKNWKSLIKPSKIDVQMSDDLVGASKSKLKSAFAKSTGSKVASRPLLNKFISMVA